MFEGVFFGLAILFWLLPVLLVAGVVYLFFHKRGEARAIDWAGVYFQIASFLLLIVVWWSLAEIWRLFLEKFLTSNGGVSPSYRDDYYYPPARFKSDPSDLERFSRMLSVRSSVFLVSLPLFLYHYLQARRRDVHKAYYTLVSLLAGGTTVVALVLLVRAAVEVLVGLSLDRELIAKSLPYLLVSGAVWVYHLRSFRTPLSE